MVKIFFCLGLFLEIIIVLILVVFGLVMMVDLVNFGVVGNVGWDVDVVEVERNLIVGLVRFNEGLERECGGVIL